MNPKFGPHCGDEVGEREERKGRWGLYFQFTDNIHLHQELDFFSY